MGHGFGGCTAIKIAMEYNHRIKNLVVIDPWISPMYQYEILE